MSGMTSLSSVAVCLAVGASVCVAPARAASDPVREIEVTASKYEFSPARIEVTQGEPVRIVIRSTDGKHGFGIDRLDVETEVPKSGNPVSIDVVAVEPGEYEIKCTKWCGKGHKRMKGLLVVKPRAGTR